MIRSRDTSRESYHDILESGLLGKKREVLYASIALHPNLTANEHFKHLKNTGRLRGEFDSNTHARFTELRDMGCIQESGRRHCSTTGRLAITWEITGRYPDPNWRQNVKGRGRRPIEDEVLDLRSRVRVLEKENIELRAKLLVSQRRGA